VPSDPVRRHAARTATLVAVPVALAVVGISLWTYADSGATNATPTTSAAAQATSPVTMTAPALTEDAAAACRTVVAKLPDTIRDLHRRPVTVGAEQNAAYGDPALTLSCGVLAPSLPPTTQVYPLSGVCWSATTSANGTIWTTVDRTVAIAVTVPGQPDGSGQSVVPLATVIANAVPRLPSPPSGCG
jgi:Protein of unknown function (DUF3515)